MGELEGSGRCYTLKSPQSASPYLGGRTPTMAQQTLGTERGRDLIAPDLWLAAWDREARRRLAEGAPAIVNDSLRFENEAAAIRGLGGVVIRLDGRRDPRVEAHVSEARGPRRPRGRQRRRSRRYCPCGCGGRRPPPA